MAEEKFDANNSARVLAEALPYIRRFHGKTIVIKYGGNAMVDEQLKRGFARDVTLMKLVGMNPVVVHGGGHEIDAEMKRAGIRKQAVDGLRITDESTLEVAISVLAGRVNTRLVAAVNAEGRPAVGLTGAVAVTLFMGVAVYLNTRTYRCVACRLKWRP